MRFLSLILFILSIDTFSCSSIVDKSKVVLFVDVNSSVKEVESARKGACAKGESFIVVPKNTKETGKLKLKFTYAQRKFLKCRKNCKKLEKNYMNLQEALAKQTKKSNIEKELEEVMSSLSKESKKITSFALSGHNGGGNFSSDAELARFLSKAKVSDLFQQYPDLASGVNSALLLGCYTTVKSEVIDWQGIFPNVKMIAGYEGKGPLGDRPSAYQFIEDILSNENIILENADQKKVKRNLEKSIRNLYDVYGGLYLDVGCHKGSSGKLYFGSQFKKNKMSSFDLSQCEKIKEEAKEYSEIVDFYYGSKPLPKNISSGKLRKIYEFSRRNDYCFINKEDSDMNSADYFYQRPDLLMKMLFYENVKENFYEATKSNAKKYTDALKGLKKEGLEDVFKYKVNEAEKKIELFESFLEEFEKSPSAYRKEQEEFVRDSVDLYNNLKYSEEFLELQRKYNDASEKESLSDDEVLKVEEILKFTSRFERAQSFLNHVSLMSDEQALESMRGYLANEKQQVENLVVWKEQVKEGLESGNVPWPITKENLKSKSRKEVLENIHLMKKYSSFMNDFTASFYPETLDSYIGNMSATPDSWFEIQADPKESMYSIF